jgi:hypothetical protein
MRRLLHLSPQVGDVQAGWARFTGHTSHAQLCAHFGTVPLPGLGAKINDQRFTGGEQPYLVAFGAAIYAVPDLQVRQA